MLAGMRLSFAVAVCLGIAVVAAACGGGGNYRETDAGLESFDTIVVEPADARVLVPLGGTVTKSYFVYGVKDGVRTDITAQCTLAMDVRFGSIAGNSVTVIARGGRTSVTATCGPRNAAADLTVVLEGSIVVGTGTPADAPQIFGGAAAGSDPARGPTIVYPIDRAVSPVNIPPIEVQWSAAGNDLFHVTLAGPFVMIHVYASDLEAALGADDWDTVAVSAAGGDLTITVEGLLRAAPTTRHAGPPIAITMSRDAIDKTAIYYWASSAGNIMSQTFGATTPPSLVRDQCTSCHSLSRAGTRLGYSRCVAGDCGQLYAGFLRYDGPSDRWVEAVNADGRTIHGSYTTFAPVGNPFPDDAQSLAIVSMVDGSLELYDPDSGAVVPSNLRAQTFDPTRSTLMADWSADGTRVVYATTPHAGQWIDLTDSGLATVSYTYTGGQHVFGAPAPLVTPPLNLANGVYTNFFFPSFSNDGRLVVFNAARMQWRNFATAAASGQRLVLADAGGAWVRDLAAMNGGPVDSDITWPHWAPNDSGDYYWIVFSSERDYGWKVTRTSTDPSCVANGVTQCKQIWIGAVSKAALAAGDPDPSAAPMWLPGQDPRTNNISPFWTAGLIVNKTAPPPPSLRPPGLRAPSSPAALRDYTQARR